MRRRYDVKAMTGPCEILTTAEARAADQGAVAQAVSGYALLHAAGTAVAKTIAERFPPEPVLVLCGPGLNGGDGYVAAHELSRRGFRVRVAALDEPAVEDAKRARNLWGGAVEPLGGDPGSARIVVDALVGAGLSRPLEGPAADALKRCEAGHRAIVAVDLPSGLPGDAAQPLGYAPTCALTVTFHRKKPAHVLYPARSFCGEVVVADIGVPEGATPAVKLWENGPDLWLDKFPWPALDAHKHARGRLGVVSGGLSHTGAARLAARAGLRSGAGLVKLYCPMDALALNASRLEAVMLQGFDTDQELEEAVRQFDAAVIGPAAGVGDQTVANLFALTRTGAALVVDADALTVFRDDPDELFGALDRDDVLTPHPGEFERIFPGLLASSPDRIAATRAAAAKAQTVVVLKGPDTVVAAPDGRATVNTRTSRWLATAGSGDVLAGLIGGLLAQGMESFEAAAAGVWVHGSAAVHAGPGLIAEDLPELVPQVLRQLYERAGEP
jgi:hydroxyethylthiazole kinase-like uncharacterized protein yjeF